MSGDLDREGMTRENDFFRSTIETVEDGGSARSGSTSPRRSTGKTAGSSSCRTGASIRPPYRPDTVRAAPARSRGRLIP